VGRIPRLTLLAPDIVEAILDWRQPEELQLDDFFEGFSLEWEGQRDQLEIRIVLPHPPCAPPPASSPSRRSWGNKAGAGRGRWIAGGIGSEEGRSACRRVGSATAGRGAEAAAPPSVTALHWTAVIVLAEPNGREGESPRRPAVLPPQLR
jgi:hypothetical protein